MTRSSFQLLLCFILTSFATARGDTYVSNLTEPDSFAEFANPNGTGGLGVAFITGNNPGGYTLTSATINAEVLTHSSPNFAMQIWSNVAGTPTALLEQLSGPTPPSNVFTDITYNSTGLFLAPNTQYWLAAQNDNSGILYWMNADSESYSSSGGWSLPAGRQTYFFNSVDGSFSNGNWTPNQPLDLKFAIDATPVVAAVPEPGTFAAAGLAVAGTLLLRRKRSTRQ